MGASLERTPSHSTHRLITSVLNAEDGFIPLAGKFTPKTTYTFKALSEENSETTFDIMVENVSEKVCQEVLKRKVDWLEEIKANFPDGTCHEAHDNALDFFFNTELSAQPDLAQNTCRSNRDCPESKPYCRNGYCTKCETGLLELTNGSCVDCPAVSGLLDKSTTNNYCHTCGDEYMLGGYQRCLGCQSPHFFGTTASKSECDRCSDRCWDESQKKCLHSLQNDAFNNNGICNYTCPTNTFISWSAGNGGSYYSCTQCPAINGTVQNKKTTATYCHACGDEYMLGQGNWCIGCKSTHSYAQGASRTECERCSAYRYWDEETEKCLLR